MRLRDTTLSPSFSLPVCVAFLTPSVPVQHGPDDRFSSGGQGAEGGGSRQGREVRWLIWARNCPTKSNFISPEACLDNRATKWPAANLTISSTNFAGDYFTRCSLVRPWGRTQRRRRRRMVGVFLAFLPLGPRHVRAGHERSVL